jgi:hypothetical protein
VREQTGDQRILKNFRALPKDNDFKFNWRKGGKMKRQTIKGVLALSVLIALTTSLTLGLAETKSDRGKEELITVTGTISYTERTTHYYVKGENPPSVLMIVNPNSQILQKLIRDGKKVTIDGRLAGGADLLFIDKIDGKPYKAFLNR